MNMIDYLHSEELDYELSVRGYPTEGTVADKRKRLRPALRMEKEGVVFPQVSVLPPEEEIIVCEQRLAEFKTAVDSFNFANAANDYRRFRSRLTHIMGRISRIVGENVASQKGELLIKCGEISDFLEENVLLLEPIQVPNMPTFMPLVQDVSTTSANAASNSGDSSGQDVNVSLLDVSPHDLQSAINQMQLNSSAHAAATPVTQSIVTTSAGGQVTSSLGQRSNFYQPWYVPAQVPNNLPAPPSGYMSSLPGTTSLPAFIPHYQAPVPQLIQPGRNNLPEAFSGPSSSMGQPTRKVNFPENPETFGPFSGQTPPTWSEHGEQARIFKTVSQWNLKYDGISSVNNFLDGVEELRLACGFSKSQLMGVAVVLFKGIALDWYRANMRSTYSWDDLAVALKAAFLPGEYEEDLWSDIRSRTQGQSERTTAFIAVMQNLFNKLSARPSETTRVRIIRRNLLPYIQKQLALHDFTSMAELTTACQRIEDSQDHIDRFKSPPSNPNLVTERDLMYNPRKCRFPVGSVQSPPPATDSSATELLHTATTSGPARASSSVVCWNCRQRGHIRRNCSRPPVRHCFGCGEPGVTKRDCPKCAGNARSAP